MPNPTVTFNLEATPDDKFRGMHHVCGPEYISVTSHKHGVDVRRDIGDAVYTVTSYRWEEAEHAIHHYLRLVAESIINEIINTDFTWYEED